MLHLLNFSLFATSSILPFSIAKIRGGNVFTILNFSLILFLLLPSLAEAHVSLTFPPARKYNLDYLDNGAIQPCGMPKGLTKTSFISGSTVNVTWHLGYPHRGTHRLELLSENGTNIYTLATQYQSVDPTAQRHQVTFPKGLTCTNCILRLMRQSAELGSPNYWFRSCGDIDIVDASQYVETCSDHGRARRSGFCGCRSGFWGDRCQYEDECRKNDDCGGPGIGACIDLGGTALPKKQCFCKHGYIGKRCSKQSNVGTIPLPNSKTLTEDYLDKNYISQELSKKFNLHWRLIEGATLQVEFVLQVNGTSYAGLGWRPAAWHGDCTRYPVYISNKSRLGRAAQSQTSRLSVNNNNDNVAPAARNQSNSSKSNRPYRRLHPMSCIDMVIGSARGSYSRILDYWSGDISTPREDSIYDGGTDDVIAGTGWETSNGLTTIIFRVNVLPDDIQDGFNDWALDEQVFLIWAKGQEHGEYVHTLPSGVDPGQPASVPNFYTRDELKYHGSSDQRGYFTTNFLADDARKYFLSRPFNG